MPPAPSTPEARSLSRRAPAPSDLGVRWVWAVLVLELLGILLDIGLGPWSVVDFEEGRNARAALHLACGHADRLLDLQYRDFCGGCTGVALVGAPLLSLLGDSVAVWKLVPAAFHIGMVAAIAAGVQSAVSRRAAVVAVVVLAATPPALRELSLTAWGNHAEVRTLVLWACALLVIPFRQRLTTVAAGLLSGLAVWFAHISLHALPALAVLAFRRGRTGGWALPAFGMGLLPLFLYLYDRPTAAQGAMAMWGQVGWSDGTDWLRYLVGPLRSGALWPPSDHPWVDVLLAGTVCLAATGTLFSTLRGVRRRHPLAGFVFLCSVGFAGATFLRPDLWADVPLTPTYGAFHVRYRAVLWPLIPIGIALLVDRSPRLALVVALPLVTAGLGARVLAWQSGPGPALHASAWHAPGRPDATVPEGNPARRNPWALDRMVDIQAAQAFLDGHSDPLPACAIDHAGELGRRIGLHVRRGNNPASDPLPQPTSAILDGIAWGLTAPAGRLPARTHGRLPSSWREPAQRAQDRLLVDIEARSDSPGTCLGLADQTLLATTGGGRLRVQGPPPDPPLGCSDPASWNEALSIALPDLGACPSPPGWPSCAVTDH